MTKNVSGSLGYSEQSLLAADSNVCQSRRPKAFFTISDIESKPSAVTGTHLKRKAHNGYQTATSRQIKIVRRQYSMRYRYLLVALRGADGR